jgi:uncharacterized protein (UPF0335 family)
MASEKTGADLMLATSERPEPKDRAGAPARFAKDQLKALIERIERLEEEKKATQDDIKDVYAEAKGNGFDVRALRTIVSLRKQDVDERREHEAVLETYMHALGMLT